MKHTVNARSTIIVILRTRLVRSALVAIAAIFAFAPPVSSHSGRTDASGCHTCRTNCAKYGLRTGQYHCHGSSRSSASSRATSPPPPPSAPVRLLNEGELPASELPENSIVRRRNSPKRGAEVQVEVITVVDGDTFVAREGEHLYLLTLQDLEAPEPGQAHGPEARERLAKLIAGRQIGVWPTKGKGCVIPVRAETLEGIDLSEWLLSEGLVWARGSASDGLRRLEAAARLARVGLWQGSDPEPPWEYRARRTMARQLQRP